MADNISASIRDDLIEQEIRYRRTDAAIRADVDRRLLQVQKDLVALAIKVDPNGAQTEAARQRRLERLRKSSGALVRDAYREIDQIVKGSARRIAKVESQNTVDIVRKHLP